MICFGSIEELVERVSSDFAGSVGEGNGCLLDLDVELGKGEDSVKKKEQKWIGMLCEVVYRKCELTEGHFR